VLLLIAVFPTNINMAMNPALGRSWPPWALYTRLPFQFVFIAIALWVSRDGSSENISEAAKGTFGFEILHPAIGDAGEGFVQ
jgi:hypothetical protein